MNCPSCGNPAIDQGECCACISCGCVFNEFDENPKTKPTDPILVCVCGANVELKNYGVNWMDWQGECKCGKSWHIEEIDESALEDDDEEEHDPEAPYCGCTRCTESREDNMRAYHEALESRRNPCGSRWKNPSNYRRYRQRPPSHFVKGRFRTVPVTHSDAPPRFKKKRGAKAVVGKLKPRHKIPGPRGGRSWTTQSVLVPKRN